MALDSVVKKALDILIGNTNISTGFFGHPCDRDRSIDLIKELIKQYPDIYDEELSDYIIWKLTGKDSVDEVSEYIRKPANDFRTAFSLIRDSQKHYNWAERILNDIRSGVFEAV
jgi:hypothetical protein